jgi:hypothetical protein
MIGLARIVTFFIVGHLVAWAVTFLAFVGFSPDLGPRYFADGWSFSGGELPTLVWLYSWPVFAVLLGFFFGARALRLVRSPNS